MRWRIAAPDRARASTLRTVARDVGLLQVVLGAGMGGSALGSVAYGEWYLVRALLTWPRHREERL